MDDETRDEASASYQVDAFLSLFAVLLLLAALIISAEVQRRDRLVSSDRGDGKATEEPMMPMRRWHPVYANSRIWILRDSTLQALDTSAVAERFAVGERFGRKNRNLDDLSDVIDEPDPSSVKIDLRIRGALPAELVRSSATWSKDDGFLPGLDPAEWLDAGVPNIFVWDGEERAFAELVTWLHMHQRYYRWQAVDPKRPWVVVSRRAAHYGLEGIVR